MKHKARITPDLFVRWLTLWAQTTDTLMVPEAAAALQGRAGRIAQSLQLAMLFRPDGRQPPHPCAVSPVLQADHG
jgi:hemoglobin